MLLSSICLVLIYFVCLSQGIQGIPYLVSLKPSHTLESFLQYQQRFPSAQKFKNIIENSFSIGDFQGFSGNFTKLGLERLKSCPLIADITPDVTINALDLTIQDDSPRHLVRLSHRERVGENVHYIYDKSASGKGVNAYVIDSGVDIKHPEFEGRATFGIDFTKEGSGDTNGHGTHVAGIIGSRTYGVAKDANIIEVKALDHSGAGSLSTIIAAIQFAVNHRRGSNNMGVANLSLGATKNRVLNKAIDAAVKTGLIIVVAAGNSNMNACSMSPASAHSAITVGAIDDFHDTLATFSNWGECVDLFASGTYVASVNPHDYKSAQVLSGTSMSAPVVSGLVANLLSQGILPADVKDTVIRLSTRNKISRLSLILRRNTPNRIAFNGAYSTEEQYSEDEND